MIFRTTFSIIAPKSFGDWTNDGQCSGTGDDPSCGAGSQFQTRTCTDGTVDKCIDGANAQTEADTKRTVTCAVAGTELPICQGNKNNKR